MCGIAGFFTRPEHNAAAMEADTRRMCDTLVHRGPDDAGVWVDVETGVALGHRRLAVVDLSPQGHQPMLSTSGRFCMVYNGEIYNHLELRQLLPTRDWRGHSDTETILACVDAWGLQGTLAKLVGMFAIALWDRQQRRLTLARDRFGEKPLYYGRLHCGDFVFGSELKALRAHPRWLARLNRDALALYMRHNAVPAPHSIYEGIYKLQPGAWLEVDAQGNQREGHYWSALEVARAGADHRLALPDNEAADRLETLLVQAVRGQMMSDVPLGAFLSGGVDSSTIVALMQANSSKPVRTFTIGFHEKGFDEAVHAKAVAKHLGTNHTEMYVTANEALAIVPRLAHVYDEPFADSSQIPTLLVSQLTRQHVTVSLSGDAGDELFAGYNRYLLAEQIWHRQARLPLGLRRGLGRAILALSPAKWNALGSLGAGLLPRLAGHGALGDKIHKFAASVLPADSQTAMYRALVSHWQKPGQLVLGAKEPRTLLDDMPLNGGHASAVEWMCLLDQLTYLPDDILVKVDRASMAVSLETRVPLLDHRVAEFAWQLPMHQKIRSGQSKWLLRQVLYRHVPRELIERPKQGFGVPLDQWLRGPLREWAESLIGSERLRAEGILDAALVRRKWDEHQQGVRNWQYLLWDVLMFQAWLDTQHDAPSTP